MTLCIPVPGDVQKWAHRISHPGLLLDKFVASYDNQSQGVQGQDAKWSEAVQRPALEAVIEKSQSAPEGLDFPGLVGQWKHTLDALDARCFECDSVSALTLHLARASALENAGICLHPVYGFTYLPGSGLKGMAHAFATQVWHPAQPDPQAAWEQIRRVFGWSPAPLLRQIAHDLKVKNLAGSCAGSVVFHDAWPVTWPRLVLDIVNNHHPEYYQADEKKRVPAPGDWENPVPVYFLAVPAGQRFLFPLSRAPRDGKLDFDPLELAQAWLLGALTHLGAGAKTNAGYGSFRPVELPAPPLDSPRHAETTITVELVTPAFLAGARQQAEDCDLRPATLRGLLRWWWRTMHAGFVDAATLRRMETAIWGDAQHGGAVRIIVEPLGQRRVEEYNYKDRYDPTPEFKLAHTLGDRPNQKTTQGLFYASYGMDDGGRGTAKRRYHVEPGAQWLVRLIARAGRFARITIDAPDVLRQAEAALWLWGYWGSCGSKARKGFGSCRFSESTLQVDSLDKCRIVAASLRRQLGVDGGFQPSHANSAAIGPSGSNWIHSIEVPIASADPWQVMDHVGFAYQAVAQDSSHEPRKVALGLPRKIHGPRNEPMKGQHHHRRPQWLQSNRAQRHGSSQNERYASPVWIHVDWSGDHHVVRAVAFPAVDLPSLKESQSFLADFMTRFKVGLSSPLRASSSTQRGAGGAPPHRDRDARQGPPPRRDPATTPASGGDADMAPLPNANTLVDAELLPERTKKGGWKARHLATGISGPVQNNNEVPADMKAGDKLQLIVAYARRDEIAFKYPTEALLQQLRGASQDPRPGQGRGRGRRGGR